MKKKLLVMMLAFAMTLAFAACGGGADSGAAAEPAAEPNAGVGDVVFVVPDGWTVLNASVAGSGSVSYSNPDSEYMLYVSTFDEESLKDVKEWNPDRSAETVQEYYEKYYTSEEALSKENLESTAVKVCDTDGQYVKYKAKSGEYMELGTYWMQDGKIYDIGMVNQDAYDEKGNLKEDATKLTDDEIATYESIVASVQPGDGAAILNSLMKTDSLGSIAFEAPEGYTLTDIYKDYISFKKDGSENITLNISRSDESSLKYMEDQNGNHPSSLKEAYEMYLYEGMEKATIAGFDGHIDKYTSEDEKYHNVSAEFLADDAIYNIYMDTSAWDNEGNIKPDAEELTEDDLAVFDAFVASLKQK